MTFGPNPRVTPQGLLGAALLHRDATDHNRSVPMNVKPTKLPRAWARPSTWPRRRSRATHRLRARYRHRVTGECDMYGKRDLIFPKPSRPSKTILDLAVALACFDQIESPSVFRKSFAPISAGHAKI